MVKLGIISVNYDFIPSEIEGPKQLWVELKNPVPRDLQIGSPVALNGKNFIVRDIVGNKIILDHCFDEMRCNFDRWGWGCNENFDHRCDNSSDCGISFSTQPQTKGCNSPKSSTLYGISSRCPMTTTNVLEYQPMSYKICPTQYEWCEC